MAFWFYLSQASFYYNIIMEENIGETFEFKGNKYKKIQIPKENHSIGDLCHGCVTDMDSPLCYAAGDCQGVIIRQYISYSELFKDL
jgi:hypothetical protein